MISLGYCTVHQVKHLMYMINNDVGNYALY